MRRLLLLFAFAAAVFAAPTIRLYLKDGDYQSVREYKVDGDRVRFLSTDRGEWEEMPLEIVDLKRTEKEASDKAAALAERVAIEQAEDDAIQADKKQVASVPDKPGVYLVEGQELKPLTESEAFRKDSTTNKILQAIAPAPIIAGKATIFIEGKAAKLRVTNTAPEFFFRLAMQERLALVKLDVKKDQRVIENVTIMPGNDEIFEDQKQMATFKKQYQSDLYKLWAEQPLEPGEYAVIEYTDGQIQVRAWDFAVDKVPSDKAK
jgi:hypothetical protein